MERDDHQAATGLEHTLGSDECVLEFLELFVDEDTQGLERPRRRVNIAGLGPNHPADEIGQRARGRERRLLTVRDDGAGNPARLPLFAEEINDVGEIAFRRARDDVGRSRACLPHPHVERTIEAEREAAAGLVELHRGHPDVHHDAVDAIDALSRADFGEVGEAIFNERQAASGAGDQLGAALDRSTVAIYGNHPGSRHVEDRAAVAAGTKGRIDIKAAFAWGEVVDGLTAKNGDVRSRAHAPSLPIAPPDSQVRSGTNKLITPRMIPRRGGSTNQPPPNKVSVPGRSRPPHPYFPWGFSC